MLAIQYCSLLLAFVLSVTGLLKGPEQECGIPIVQPDLDDSDIESRGRIFNGQAAVASSWPWQVQLRYQGQKICGGTLIGQKFVLTAAHCFDGLPAKKFWTVHLGKHFGNKFDQEEVVRYIYEFTVHPKHRSKAESPKHVHRNDIAVIRLNEPVQFGRRIQPVCLPSIAEDPEELIKPGRITYITGWGLIDDERDSNVLNQDVLHLYSRDLCLHSTASATFYSKSMICAGSFHTNKGSCLGDSGGPMVTRLDKQFYLIGIVSGAKKECGSTLNPSVFTNVLAFDEWIKRTIKKSLRKHKKTRAPPLNMSQVLRDIRTLLQKR